MKRRKKIHKGKREDCPACQDERLGIDECFRRIVKE